MDRIELGEISAQGYHGVYPYERVEGQPFLARVALYLDTAAAATSDQLEDTVDYTLVAEKVSEVLTGAPVNLIETLAARVASAVLEFPQVSATEVTIEKPEAQLQATTGVKVTIRRDRQWAGVSNPAPAPVKQDVVLGFGGNQGDVRQNFLNALEKMIDDSRIQVRAISPLVRTAALLPPGGEEQPDYLNCVVTVQTQLPLPELLQRLKQLEDAAGRVQGEHWQPRPLDIDIICAGDQSVRSAELTVPHQRAHERIFVLYPWSRLEPQAQLPGRGKVVDLLANLSFSEILGTWDDWLENDPKINLHSPPPRAGEIVSPRTYDFDEAEDAPAAGESSQSPGLQSVSQGSTSLGFVRPQRRPLSELFQAASQASTKHLGPGGSERENTDTSIPSRQRRRESRAQDTDTKHAKTTGPALRTATHRRVVVRPTTTGTMPMLSREELERLRNQSKDE